MPATSSNVSLITNWRQNCKNVNFCTQSKCPRQIFTPREERKSRQVYLEGMVVKQVLLQVNALSNPLLHVKGLKCFSAILQCLNEICKQRVFLLTCMFAALSLTQLLITKRYLAQKKVGWVKMWPSEKQAQWKSGWEMKSHEDPNLAQVAVVCKQVPAQPRGVSSCAGDLVLACFAFALSTGQPFKIFPEKALGRRSSLHEVPL